MASFLLTPKLPLAATYVKYIIANQLYLGGEWEQATRALDAIPYAAMREALEGLVKRLDEINQHPSFGGIWPFLHVHNYNYDGPNWVEPLDKARAALRAADGEEATNEQRGP